MKKNYKFYLKIFLQGLLEGLCLVFGFLCVVVTWLCITDLNGNTTFLIDIGYSNNEICIVGGFALFNACIVLIGILSSWLSKDMFTMFKKGQ